MSVLKYTRGMAPVYLRTYTGVFFVLNGIEKFPYVRQRGLRVVHEGMDLGIGLIPDNVIDKKVIIELKSVETLAKVHY